MTMELFDIAISFDTTGSMYSCLSQVKSNMRNMMRKLTKDIPGIRLSVIAHGDYDTDHTYVIKYKDLTNNIEDLCTFVMSAEATGGAYNHRNLDEAYELALNYARRRLSWRDNCNRVFVMIGDHNPHGKHYDLNKDCIDWQEETELLRNMDVKIYAVQCEANSCADAFYNHIASKTFGQHVALTNFTEIEKILMGICYREAGISQSSVLTATNSTTPMFIPQANLTPITPAHVSPASHVDASESNDSDSDEEQLGLICPMCKVGKLANEFPPCTVSDQCCHASLICLRCVIKHVNGSHKCPQEGCDIDVDPNCNNMKLFSAILDRMFVDYNEVLKRNKLASRPEGDMINVCTITGETEWIPYDSNMRISELKKEIGRKLDLKPEQQRLIYNEINLKADMRLADYSIPKNATLSLILPLYCIPEHLDHVVFDLSWEFPAINPDFLDATCMAFAKAEFIQVIDWNHPSNEYYLKGSIKHSEKNLTGAGAKTGHQTIHVHLKKVPANITHLYFVLSSWRSPNLSAFRNPALKFYEASSENIDLCETTITHALHSQAVLMCYAVRLPGRRDWQIFECGAGALVNGNAKRYNPIRQKIADLIDNE